MKTPIRFSFLILTLGLFSSCTEQFREIRGSENRGNAFFGTGIAKSTATKRTDKANGERVTPQQTVIPVEQAASEIAAESTPKPCPVEPEIEKTETNPTSVSQGQKSNISSKNKGSSIHILKKTKLSNPIKNLKKSLLQRDNGKEVNGWLMALGIVGIISSTIGLLYLLFAAALGNSSLIMELLGFDFYSITIDIIVFLLGLISSIWLVKNPTLEDANAQKIAAIVLAALPVYLLWILFLGIILGFFG